MQFRPMLAGTAKDLSKLKYPLLGSCKLDGVRAVVIDGVLLSRSLKPIPNKFLQSRFKMLERFDGELILGDPDEADVFRRTSSAVMTIDEEPDVDFHAFDYLRLKNVGFIDRYNELRAKAEISSCPNITVIPQKLIRSEQELLTYEELVLKFGYEGVMLRSIDGPYKCGRSTVNEGYLLKLKRFMDSEAIITGFVEEMHNGNVAKTNALGLTERSHSKANKVGKGILGALQVTDLISGVDFEVSSGLNHQLKTDIWNNREAYIGKIITYKFFPIGIKEKPRLPVFKGFRAPIDM